MESNAQLEDSKSSSEDSGRSEQSNDDDMGTGRSYECVFCKRGFTTAQALGGHMNIHRKDRAKSRPTVSDKVNDDDNYNAALRSSYSYPSPIQSYHHPHYPVAPEVHVSYQAFFPASGWGFRPPNTHHSDGLFIDNSQHMNPFGEGDWPRSLSLGIGPSHLDNHENKTYGSSQEDEVDLELRLGHDP